MASPQCPAPMTTVVVYRMEIPPEPALPIRRW